MSDTITDQPVKCHGCGVQRTIGTMPEVCVRCNHKMPVEWVDMTLRAKALREALEDCLYRGFRIVKTQTHDGTEEYWVATKVEWNGNEDNRPSALSGYLSRSASEGGAFRVMIDDIDRQLVPESKTREHKNPEVIHGRMIFWCSVRSDPFFPHYEEDAFVCGLCGMKVVEAKDREWWDYFHAHLGGVGMGTMDAIVEGKRPLLGHEG